MVSPSLLLGYVPASGNSVLAWDCRILGQALLKLSPGMRLLILLWMTAYLLLRLLLIPSRVMHILPG